MKLNIQRRPVNLVPEIHISWPFCVFLWLQLMVCWETGDLGTIVQRPVKVTGKELGHVFLRQTVEHHAVEVQPKQKSVAPTTVQVLQLSFDHM
mgnify:CR=1 FL=1